MNKIYNYIIYFIIIYTLILIISPKRYKSYLPTIPIYPDSEEEALLVLKLSKNRTQEDIDFFNLTDVNMTPVFLPYVDETLDELQDIILDEKVINYILFFKYLINRARPYQINPNINYLDSVDKINLNFLTKLIRSKKRKKTMIDGMGADRIINKLKSF